MATKKKNEASSLKNIALWFCAIVVGVVLFRLPPDTLSKIAIAVTDRFLSAKVANAGIPEAVTEVANMANTVVNKASIETHDARMIISGKNEALASTLGQKVIEAEKETEVILGIAYKDYSLMRCYSSIQSYISQLEVDEIIEELTLISTNKHAKFFSKNSPCNNIEPIGSA